jgi:hypothetical protein
MTRRGLGALLMAIGLVVTTIGAFELVSSAGGGTAAASPTPGLPSPAPSPTPAVTAVAPTTTATPDPDALVGAFVANLATQIGAGTQVALLDALDPAVIARYGVEACRTQLASFPPDPTYGIVVNTVATPAPWDYASDARTTTIPDALAVDAIVTGGGVNGATPSSATRTLHFHLVDGVVRWFTDCGTPLP